MPNFKFGPASMERRETLHPDLQDLVDLAIQRTEEDFSIICGYRGIDEQEKAYAEGNSNARFGQSKHNYYPSMAVDLAPYPIDWENEERFKVLSEVMFDCAAILGIKIKWGGDFKSIKGDSPHFELVFSV